MGLSRFMRVGEPTGKAFLSLYDYDVERGVIARLHGLCPGMKHLTQRVSFETIPDIYMTKALSHSNTLVSTYCYF